MPRVYYVIFIKLVLILNLQHLPFLREERDRQPINIYLIENGVGMHNLIFIAEGKKEEGNVNIYALYENGIGFLGKFCRRYTV